jgi:hypothetical protein
LDIIKKIPLHFFCSQYFGIKAIVGAIQPILVHLKIIISITARKY